MAWFGWGGSCLKQGVDTNLWKSIPDPLFYDSMNVPVKDEDPIEVCTGIQGLRSIRINTFTEHE